MNNPSASLVELLSFVIGILGLVASVHFYIRSKEMPKPVWRSGGISLIGSNSALLPADVDVRYRNASVQSLAKTYIAFWNAGRKTISGSDIVQEDRISFHFGEECKVLDSRVIRRSRDVNQVLVNHHNNEVQLTFDFLDQKDGVTLEIVHTGINTDVKCTGTIRGIPQGIRHIGPIGRSRMVANSFSTVVLNSPSRISIIVQSIAAILTTTAGLFAIIVNKNIIRRRTFDTSYKAYLTDRIISYKTYLSNVHQIEVDVTIVVVFIGIIALVSALVVTTSLIIRLRLRLPERLSLTWRDMSDRPVDKQADDIPVQQQASLTAN